MTNAELIEENKQLHQMVADREADLKEIARNLYKVVGAIGLTPEDLGDHKKAKKKALKSIGSLTMDAVTDPEGLEERFSFLKEFKPLFDKYKHLVDEIKEEENE